MNELETTADTTATRPAPERPTVRIDVGNVVVIDGAQFRVRKITKRDVVLRHIP